MNRRKILPLLLAAASAAVASAQEVEPIAYNHNGDELEGYRAIPMGATGPVPAVVILPYVAPSRFNFSIVWICCCFRCLFVSKEPTFTHKRTIPYLLLSCFCSPTVSDANGVNAYEQLRAVMIAEEFGYVGFAADIYGKDLHNVTDRMQRNELLDFYRLNATRYVERIQAAVDLVRSMDEVDAENVAIIGYCFGGTGVLTYALTTGRMSNVSAVVSFHGGLVTLPDAGPEISPKILVFSGGDDDNATEIMDLESTLDAANATWEITRYSGTGHAFTVFDDDRYNKYVDMRSWDSMWTFLKECFGEMPFEAGPPEATNVTDVPYTDVDGTKLQGYLSMPSQDWQTPYSAVVILP